MSSVIKFPGHKRMRCRDAECTGCQVCNLYLCTTCDGAEASLPTHCPGSKMDSVMQLCVMQGSADYVDGEWKFKGADGNTWRITS